jgi:hypothetical protein
VRAEELDHYHPRDDWTSNIERAPPMELLLNYVSGWNSF